MYIRLGINVNADERLLLYEHTKEFEMENLQQLIQTYIHTYIQTLLGSIKLL